jgi:diguanylate cyclase (GGDEF)-like protein/PAS domain S-box-containing protein
MKCLGQKENLKYYDMIFNGTQDLMFLMDLDENQRPRYRRLNLSHEKLSGLTTAKVFGKTPEQVFGSEIGNQIDAHLQECIRTKSPLVFQETLKFPSGIRTWSTLLSPVLEAGNVVQIIGSRRDITELQKAMVDLKESEERYSSLFENNHSVMLIINPQDGHIIDANPAACMYYGYSRENISSLNIADVNTLSKEQIQDEMQKAALEHQKPFFFQHRLFGGEIRNVEVYSGPIDISGQRLLYSIVHDVTERKKAEAELFQEKEQLRVTLHSIGDGVITTDIEGKITLINEIAEELTGWSSEEAVGKPLPSVFHIINEETKQMCENPAQKALETGRIIELDNNTLLISKNGEKRFISDSGAPIRDKDGKVFGIVLVFRDVTEKKLQENEIRYLSFHDKLTGLYNRAFFEREIKNFDQPEFLPLSLVIGDVNGLKLTNDIFGHEVGDKLLKTISGTLEKEYRGEGIVARWGGDEFVMILPKTSKNKALSLCNQIQNRFLIMPQDPIQPSITFGASTKERMDSDIRLVLKDAEDIMYRRKLLEGKSVRSSLITSLEKTLYARSYETEEHAQRILSIALKVGREMGLSASELDELGLLAILHDIGKIGIPDHILTKPDRLNEEEWREMKKHPEIGYRIAQSTPELSHVADLILSHHERWDGNGYPIGCKGNNIPKLARIITIIDSYDVMTHSRPYKDAMTVTEAINEIHKCAGSQFDPDIADIFINMIDSINVEKEKIAGLIRP